MKKTIIYARVSSTTDRQTTDRQIIDLQTYASKNDMEVIQVFEEHISGAKKNNERPILMQCLDFALSNGVELILCNELSRLGRNCDELLKNVMFCKEHKLNIYFQKEGFALFDTNGVENPYINIMVAVLGTAAQLERENIKFRLNSGRAKYIAEGGKLGRKKGGGKTAAQILEQYPNVVKELKGGESMRRVAKLCNVCLSTVQKVAKAMKS